MGQCKINKSVKNQQWDLLQCQSQMNQMQKYFPKSNSNVREEQRLLRQLATLDQKLIHPHHSHHPKYNEIRSCDKIYLGQSGYSYSISEINEELIEEDSLFEHHAKIFQHVNPINQPQINPNLQNKHIPHVQDYNSFKQNRDCNQRVPNNNKNKSISQKKLVQKDNQIKKNNLTDFKIKEGPIRTVVHNQNHKEFIMNNFDTEEANNDKIDVEVNIEDYFEFLLQNKQAIANFKQKENSNAKKYQKIQKENKNSVPNQFLSNSLECTFKPKILKKSEEMLKNAKPVMERLTTSIANKKDEKLPYQSKQQHLSRYSAKRIQQLSKPRRLKTTYHQPFQEEKHSFRPSISKKGLNNNSHQTFDIASRNKLWLEQREEKINKLRQEEEEEKLRKEKCTYSPAILHYKGESQVQLSKFGKEGIANFFQRSYLAKKKSSFCNSKKQIKMSSNGVGHEYEGQLKRSVSKANIGSVSDKYNNKVHAKTEQSQNNREKKKQTYEEAVRQLHKKIMRMNI